MISSKRIVKYQSNADKIIPLIHQSYFAVALEKYKKKKQQEGR